MNTVTELVTRSQNELTTAEVIAIAMQEQTLNAKIDINISAFNSWKQTLSGNERTVIQYTKQVWYFIKWLECKGITRPTEETVNGYIDIVKQNHKPNTVQNYKVSISKFFKWLEKIGVYPDITKDVQRVKVDRTEFKHDYLTIEETKALLNAVDRSTLTGKRDYAILLTMATCGTRTIEVVSALIKDISKHGNEYRVYLKGKGDFGKSSEYADKTQYVKLEPFTYKAIMEYLEARKPGSKNEPLFISQSNRTKNTIAEMNTSSIRRIVKKYFKAIGIDDERHTAHSLRHTTVTLILLNGGTIEEASQVARHKSITTTQIYNHAITRDNNKGEARIEQALFSV